MGIAAVIKHLGGTHYKAMTMQELQKYNEQIEQAKEKLKDKTIWESDTSNENNHRCKQCNVVCKNLRRVSEHIESDNHRSRLGITSQRERTYSCSICKSSFAYENDLKKHNTTKYHKKMEEYNHLYAFVCAYGDVPQLKQSKMYCTAYIYTYVF